MLAVRVPRFRNALLVVRMVLVLLWVVHLVLRFLLDGAKTLVKRVFAVAGDILVHFRFA